MIYLVSEYYMRIGMLFLGESALHESKTKGKK